MQVLDISDPANPAEVSRYNTPGRAVNVLVRGDYAYVADYSAGLRILDISDPSNPTEVSSISAQDDVWDIGFKGTYAYVADRGLRVFDISDPANPTVVGRLNASDSAWDVTVSGNYAYIANDNAGVRTIDIADPTAPSETGYFNTPDPAYGVASSGQYVYVAAEESGVYIIRNQSAEDVTPPAAPTGLKAVPGDGQVELSWNANSESDLSSYRLYRYVLPQKETQRIATFSTGTETYTDTDLTNGRTHSYWVTAVDVNGNESEFSEEVKVIPEGSEKKVDLNIDLSGDYNLALTSSLVIPGEAPAHHNKLVIKVSVTNNGSDAVKNIKIDGNYAGSSLKFSDRDLKGNDLDKEDDGYIDKIPPEGNVQFFAISKGFNKNQKDKLLEVSVIKANGIKQTGLETQTNVSLYFAKDADGNPYSFSEDSYSFKNPHLTLNELIDIGEYGDFGPISFFWKLYQSKDGICYGMAATSGLYLKNPDQKPISGNPRKWGESFTVLEKITDYHVHQLVNFSIPKKIRINYSDFIPGKVDLS